MSKRKRPDPDDEKYSKAFLSGTAQHFNNTGSTKGMAEYVDTFKKTVSCRKYTKSNIQRVEKAEYNAEPSNE
jgi:hypothetical protein